MALKAPYAMPSTDAGAYDEGEGIRRLRALIQNILLRWSESIRI